MAITTNMNYKRIIISTIIGLGLILITLILVNKTQKPLTEDQQKSVLETRMQEAFQKDADIVRLCHLKYWITKIEDYHNKTGAYPLESMSDTPVYVFIGSKNQQALLSNEYFSPYPASSSAIKYSMNGFINELEKGLGETLNEYYDPQEKINPENNRPNIYTYTIDNGNYTFNVNTHQNYLFSKFIAPDFHKVEVSNKGNPSANLILTPQTLFNSSHYKIAAGKEMSNPNLFENNKLNE